MHQGIYNLGDLIGDADFWRTDYSSEPDHLYKYSVRPVRPFLSESHLEHLCPTMQETFATMSSSLATLTADSLSVKVSVQIDSFTEAREIFPNMVRAQSIVCRDMHAAPAEEDALAAWVGRCIVRGTRRRPRLARVDLEVCGGGCDA